MEELKELNDVVIEVVPKSFALEILLCGSAVYNNKIQDLQDVDYMIYIDDSDITFFQEAITSNLSFHFSDYKINFNYDLNLLSVKFTYNHKVVSLHVIKFEDLFSYLLRNMEISSFENVNLFDFKLYIPVICRKWVLDTIHVFGNTSLKNKALNFLKANPAPFRMIELNVIKKLINAINYYNEKKSDDSNAIVNQILVIQIVNLLFLLCYSINQVYIPTH